MAWPLKALVCTLLVPILVASSLFSYTNQGMGKVYAVSPVPSGSNIAHLLTYENSTYGLKIKYPETWTEELLSHGIRISIPGYPTSSFSDSIDVKVYPAYCNSLDSLVANEIKYLHTFNDFKLTKISAANMGGLIAKVILYSYSDSNIGMTKAMEAIASTGNYVYYVEYLSKPQNYQNHIQFAKDFINSISIDPNVHIQTNNLVNAATHNYLNYENSTFGIKVDYLGNWSIRQEGTTVDNQTDNVVEFDAPCDGPKDKYTESLNISLRLVEGDNATINDYLDEAKNYFKTTFKKFKIVEEKNNTATGTDKYPSFELVFTGIDELSNTNIKVSQIGALVKNKLYFIDYYAEATKYESYLPVIEHMMDSMELGKMVNPVMSVGNKGSFEYYSDTYNGFRLKYSTDWEIEREPGSAIVAFGYPYKDFIANIRVYKVSTSGYGNSLDRFVSNYVNELENTFPNLQVLSRTQTWLGDLDADQIVFTYDTKFEGHPKVKGKIMQTIAIRGKNAYIVSFGSNSADYPYQLAPIQAMLNSFEFLPEPKTISRQYVNHKIGLQIDFPEGWSGRELIEGDKITTFMYPGQDDKGYNPDKGISLMAIVSYNKTNGDVEGEGRGGGDHIDESGVSCNTPSEIHPTLLNNMSAVKFKVDCEYSSSNQAINLEGYYFERGGQIIIVGLGTNSKSAYNNSLSEFINSLKSLSIEGTNEISTEPLIQFNL